MATSTALSVATSWAGGQIGGLTSTFTSNLTAGIASPILQQAASQALNNSITGFALGAGMSLAGSGSVSDALGSGFSGAAEGFTVGAITGGVAGYQDASKYNKNPWTGDSTLPELEPAHYAEGSFSISNWDGYPTVGGVPQPVGPFRLLEGQEYKDALALKNSTNQALHRANPELKGYDIHEIHPVKFGGSPTDINNKIILPKIQHTEYNIFWLKMMNQIYKKNHNAMEWIEKFNKNSRPSETDFHAFVSKIDFPVDDNYLKFIETYEGATYNFPNGSFISLWPINEIIEVNRLYQEIPAWNNYFIFGNNGSDQMYAFNKQDGSIISSDIYELGEIEPDNYGTSFNIFLDNLSKKQA